MFYEIRRYQTQAGRREEWVRYMEDVVLPYQQSKGMTVTASFIDDEDPDGYVWIRRVDDETPRSGTYRAGARGRLPDRMGAVHVLPSAHVEPVGVQCRYEPVAELGPWLHAIGGLDDQRFNSGRARVGRNRRQVAPIRTAHVPDPHRPAIGRPS